MKLIASFLADRTNGRALRRAGRAAAAEFFSRAAAAEIFGHRRRKSAAWLKMRPSPKDSQ